MKNFLRSLVPALALLAAGVSPLSALDLTLHRGMANPQTGGMPKPFFLDGDSKIFISVPLDWKISDSPAALDCLPPQANCRVLIELAGAPWVFDETNKAVLRKRALGAVPAGSKEVQALAETPDLIPLTGWGSLEFEHTYEFFGQKMHRALIFLNLPEKRVLQVTITTPEANFAVVHEQTRSMLYGLFEPTKMLSSDALKRYNDGVQD